MAHPGSPFTFGERLGLILLAETSAVSACSIIGLLSYIAYSAVCIIPGSSRRWRIGGPAQVYFLNQLLWDLVQAIGGLMNVKWAVDADVKSGAYCSAQGAVKQMSDVGSAISTLIISFYTLRVLCFWRIGNNDGETDTEQKEWKMRLSSSFVVVACLWAALGLLVGINVAVDGVRHFYGPTGYWCWIRAEYSVQRTATDFVFMWATVLCTSVAYGILFLYFKGYITTDGWHIRVCRKPESLNVLGPPRQAYGLLFYPLVYTVTITPISVARYSAFAHHQVPFAVTCFVDIIYLSTGLLNVLLFSFTRPYLLPHDPPISDTMSESESFHSISIINIADTSHNEGPNEGEKGENTQRPEWYGLPRTESPTGYGDSTCGGDVQGQEKSLHEKVGVKDVSWHSIGV